MINKTKNYSIWSPRLLHPWRNELVKHKLKAWPRETSFTSLSSAVKVKGSAVPGVGLKTLRRDVRGRLGVASVHPSALHPPAAHHPVAVLRGERRRRLVVGRAAEVVRGAVVALRRGRGPVVRVVVRGGVGVVATRPAAACVVEVVVLGVEQAVRVVAQGLDLHRVRAGARGRAVPAMMIGFETLTQRQISKNTVRVNG